MAVMMVDLKIGLTPVYGEIVIWKTNVIKFQYTFLDGSHFSLGQSADAEPGEIFCSCCNPA
jgi:hypothetical protein